jgi:tripartite-type tricarboxylate transporter receptor subunit TctC
MKLPRRNFLHLAAGAAALPAVTRVARAQAYPTRPVTIIVPVPPGGVADPIARILADHLTVRLGQPVVVENITGAGGSIGVGRAVRAAPDGYGQHRQLAEPRRGECRLPSPIRRAQGF